MVAAVMVSIGSIISATNDAVLTAILSASIKSTLVQETGTVVSRDFSRAGTATFTDFEGIIKTADIDEVRFEGARRVKNELSSNLNDWSFQSGGGTMVDTVDPFGNSGTGAKRITTNIANDFFQAFKSIPSSVKVTNRVWFRSVNVTGSIRFDLRTGFVFIPPSLMDGNWHLVSTINNLVSTVGFLFSSLRITNAGDSIEIFQPQIEVVEGQANTFPSEFVSSGEGVGPNLLQDGNFSLGNQTYWLNGLGTPTVTFNNGVVGITFNSALNETIAQGFSTVIGRSYLVEATTVSVRNDHFVIKSDSQVSWSVNRFDIISIKPKGTYRKVFVATATISYIHLLSRSSTIPHEYANISVKELDHGSKVDSVKGFETLNGNTVLNSVLIEATGLEIPTATLKGVVIEPQVTNLCIGSENFGVAPWNTRAGTALTIANNTILSPTGSLTASRFTGLGLSTVDDTWQTVTVVAGTTYSPSFWIKKITPTGTLTIADPSAIAGNYTINFALLGTGWELIDRTHAAVTIVQEFLPTGTSSGLHLYTTAGTLDFDIFGASFVKGKVTVNYIATTTSSATKPADTFNFTTIAGFPTTDITIVGTWTPLANGSDIDIANSSIFGTRDSRGSSNEIRTVITGSYGFTAGGVFLLNKIDFVKNQPAIFAFSLKQNVANIDWQVASGGVIKGSGSFVGTLDHSNLGTLSVSSWVGSFFYAETKNIEVWDGSLSFAAAVLKT